MVGGRKERKMLCLKSSTLFCYCLFHLQYNIIAKYDGACYKAHDINGSSNVNKTSYIGWIIIAV